MSRLYTVAILDISKNSLTKTNYLDNINQIVFVLFYPFEHLERRMSTNRFDRSPLLVALLSNFGRNDLAMAGGKGANLGELIQAGFDIPGGFVITKT